MINIQHYNLDDILNHDDIKFSKITIDDGININGRIYYFTNEENSFALHDDIMSFTKKQTDLSINRKFFENNRELIMQIIVSLIKKSACGSFALRDKELLTDEVLNAVFDNKEITSVSLRNMGFSLTKSLYDKAKKNGNIDYIYTDSIDSELEYTYDDMIVCSNGLYDGDSYDTLKTTDHINYCGQKGINHLKLLKPECEIRFSEKYSIDDLSALIEFMQANNMKNKITVVVKDKKVMNDFFFSNEELIRSLNMQIYTNGKYDINYYLDKEKELTDLIRPAMNLSPLEKYLYAYNIVKQFKEYKENEDDLLASRDIYDILDNDYMVCVGYAKLLSDLCAKLDIKCDEISVGVNVGFDKTENEEVIARDNLVENGGHARAAVYINDPKYGINGIYFADPTWDNYMDKDIYVHALMTQNEHDSMIRENILNDVSFFAANNIEELCSIYNALVNAKFYKKIKTAKQAESKIRKIIEEKGDITYEEYVAMAERIIDEQCELNKISSDHIGDLSKQEAVNDILYDLQYIIKKNNVEKAEQEITNSVKTMIEKGNHIIDTFKANTISSFVKFFIPLYPEVAKQIEEKYPDIYSSTNKLNDEEILGVLNIINYYSTKLNNNTVDARTIFSAVRNVYKAQGMSEEEIEYTLPITIAYNKEKFENAFPKRIKIQPDGTEEVYNNEFNKFDLDRVDNDNARQQVATDMNTLSITYDQMMSDGSLSPEEIERLMRLIDGISNKCDQYYQMASNSEDMMFINSVTQRLNDQKAFLNEQISSEEMHIGL